MCAASVEAHRRSRDSTLRALRSALNDRFEGATHDQMDCATASGTGPPLYITPVYPKSRLTNSAFLRPKRAHSLRDRSSGAPTAIGP